MPDPEEINTETTTGAEDVPRKPSSFREKEGDPGFLVAKGRFYTAADKKLKQLISDGVATSDPRLPILRKEIESERRFAEKRHVKDLASAIFMAVSNHGYATIRCIGRNACYNASKAIAIATGYCATKGVNLQFGISFDEGNLGSLRQQQHVVNVTALVFTLEGHSKYVVEDGEE